MCHALASESISLCAAAVVQKPRRKRSRQRTMSEQSTATSDVSSHQTSAAIAKHPKDTPSASVIRK